MKGMLEGEWERWGWGCGRGRPGEVLADCAVTTLVAQQAVASEEECTACISLVYIRTTHTDTHDAIGGDSIHDGGYKFRYI